MLSKSKIKLINKLKTNKGRKELGLFIVEGEKMINELIHSSFNIEFIVAVPDWILNNSSIIGSILIIETDDATLKKISLLTTPNKVLAVAEIKKQALNYEELKNELTIILDTIQDPGNLGTIIRTANWFGIKKIICSENSADVFNPKVIQATMGAIFRVHVFYEELEALFQKLPPSFPVFGTFLEGENIYSQNLSDFGFIVFGNESKGINKSIENYISHKITIPPFPESTRSMESLNITSAASIICAEFRRRIL